MLGRTIRRKNQVFGCARKDPDQRHSARTTAGRRCPARRRACRTISDIDYGVGSAKKPPRISLLPKVAGQEPSTSGGAIGEPAYSDAR
jgi:hypothetical protein